MHSWPPASHGNSMAAVFWAKCRRRCPEGSWREGWSGWTGNTIPPQVTRAPCRLEVPTTLEQTNKQTD